MKSHSITSSFFAMAIALPLAVGSASAADDLQVFQDLVLPTLEAKCVSCHGAEKQKGKLRVDSYAALKKGGSEDVGFIAGDAFNSSIIFRMDLPLEDDEHMPPEDEPQVTDGEKALIKLWIDKGAKEDILLSALGLPDDLKKTVDEILASAKSKPKKVELTEAEKKAAAEAAKVAESTMAKVNATGASLMPVAQDVPELRFSSLNARDTFNDSALASLKPVEKQLSILELGGSQVTDAGLKHISGMTNLTRLYLENTKVTDAGLNYLTGLQNLDYLNLYGTKVTDAGIQKLASLKNLKSLYLWQSDVTEAGADNLKKALPELYINLGWQYEAKQSAVLVASNAPSKAPDPKPAAKPAPAKEPAVQKAPTPAKEAKPASWDNVAKSLQSAHAEAKQVVDQQKQVADGAAKKAADAAATEAQAKKKVAALKTKLNQAETEASDLDAIIAALNQALQMVSDSKALPGVQADLEAKKKLKAQATASAEQAKKDLAAAEKQVAATAKAAADAKAASAGAQKTLADRQAALNAITAAVASVKG